MTELQEKMIDELFRIINETDWEAINNKIEEMQDEIKTLKAVINFFINGIEKDNAQKEIKLPQICKHTLLLNEYQQWLLKEKEIKYRDCGIRQNAMIDCYDKLIELRKKYESGDINE